MRSDNGDALICSGSLCLCTGERLARSKESRSERKNERKTYERHALPVLEIPAFERMSELLTPAELLARQKGTAR